MVEKIDKEPLVVKVINTSKNPTPQYKTAGAAGMDLHCIIEIGFMVLNPLERVALKTGIFLEIPEGYEAQIRPRSGMAAKHGLTIINSPGTIDSDYRGELHLLVVNLSNSKVVINDGERLGQIVFAKYERAFLEHAEGELSQTERGEGGLGSTGTN